MGKPNARSETCPDSTLSTTKPTGSDQQAIMGLRNQRPVTNHLRHGTTLVVEAAVLSKTLVYYYHYKCHHMPEIIIKKY